MSMLEVVLIVVTLWPVAGLALALLTGGMIHERDAHDRPARRGSIAL